MRLAIVAVVLACGHADVPAPQHPPPSVDASTASIEPPVVADPNNLDFELADGDLPKGFAKPFGDKGYAVTLDPKAHRGKQSVRIASTGDARGFSATGRRFDATPFRNKHVAVHGWVSTADVDGYAGLWIRADAPDDQIMDNMNDRGLHGSNAWTRVTAEIDVPEDATDVVLGPIFVGGGTAWYDELSIEVKPIEPEKPPVPIAIGGHVLDASKHPVAGAWVTLTTGSVTTPTKTDANGAFKLTGMSGRVALSAHHAPDVGTFVEGLVLAADTDKLELVLGAPGTGTTIDVAVKSLDSLPATGEIEIGATSTHEGDVWVTPFAGGKATVVIPVTDRYFANGRGNLVGHIDLANASHAKTIAGILDVSVAAPAPPAIAEYIKARAIPLTTAVPGHGFDDMAPLAKLVGSATVVGLGEATHGTREYFQMKHRMFEYLVDKLGFTVFALEAYLPECRAIDDYVLEGRGDAKTALAGIDFWTWNTEEVLDLVEWMRSYNAKPEHAKKPLRFTGYDMQSSVAAHHTVAALLAKIDPDHADARMKPIAILGEPSAPSVFGKLAPADRASVGAALDALARDLDANRAAYSKKASVVDFTTARRDLVVLQQWFATNNASSTADGQVESRDRAMADNIVWLRTQFPGAKMVVWAHNFHVSRVPGSMGAHVAKALGKTYLPIGFVFGEGTFQAMSPGKSGLQLKANTVGLPSETDTSAPFVATGIPIFVLDLRGLPKGPVATWFSRPHPTREIGSTFTGEMNMIGSSTLTTRFDAVIFVKSTTRAVPIKN